MIDTRQPLFDAVWQVQRWRERRDSYRPAGETIDRKQYEVAEIEGDAVVRDFVSLHHYIGTLPPTRFRYGLYRHGQLVGVAAFTVPQNYSTYGCFEGFAAEKDKDYFVDLGRFVLLDDVEGNGETFFLSRCFRDLKRKSLCGVVAFSDPMPRAGVNGRPTSPGHIGVIYQSFGGKYLGTSSPRTLWFGPDGRQLVPRAVSKLRNGEVGGRDTVSRLLSWGATKPSEDLKGWVEFWTQRLASSVRHPGNLKYAWALDDTWRRALPKGLPYPKRRQFMDN